MKNPLKCRSEQGIRVMHDHSIMGEGGNLVKGEDDWLIEWKREMGGGQEDKRIEVDDIEDAKSFCCLLLLLFLMKYEDP